MKRYNNQTVYFCDDPWCSNPNKLLWWHDKPVIPCCFCGKDTFESDVKDIRFNFHTGAVIHLGCLSEDYDKDEWIDAEHFKSFIYRFHCVLGMVDKDWRPK